MTNKPIIVSIIFFILINIIYVDSVVLAENPVKTVESIHKKTRLNKLIKTKRTIYNNEIIIKATQQVNLKEYELTSVYTPTYMKKRGFMLKPMLKSPI
jgi:hypothetical protein